MRIALFLPNWVGDAVMATPAIRAIRERFFDAYLIGVGKPYVAGVLEGSPHLNQWINFDKRGSAPQRLIPVARSLRENQVDLGIIFPNSFRTALLACLGGCKRRIGFARYGRSVLLTDRLSPLQNDRRQNVPVPVLLDYNLLAARAGAPVNSLQMELFTTQKHEELADEIWARMGFTRRNEIIALNPGAAFGSAKLWPAEYFAELARRLIDERGCQVLVLCGPGDRDLARQIVCISNRSRVFSLAHEPVSLGLTKACIKRCNLLITTDSGPRHFAAAFQRPVVTLFGPTFMDWTNTFFPFEIQLQRRVSCGPCQRRHCHLDHRCMTELKPDEVYRSVVALLDRVCSRPLAEVPHAA